MRAPLLALLAFGCAGSGSLPGARFANAPVVRAVDDRRDVPAKPAYSQPPMMLYQIDGSLYRPMTRALEVPRHRRALGVNAVDEVPDSTWFTNRIGIRGVAPEELRAPPGGVGSPEPHLPWTIHSTKVGGWEVGFIITDARGQRFLLKFDMRDLPETETAAQIITGRLLWAAGYNVTDDYIVHFRREDLRLAPGATIKNSYGKDTPLDRAELDRRLATVALARDGRIRGLASAWIPGQPLGGHAGEGVRADDPNDRIPHELRRDLRGAYPIYAWLDHTDTKQANMFDTWVQDPRDPNRHYVKHFTIDYGKSLGLLGVMDHDRRIGLEYRVDWGVMFRKFATAGLEGQEWEHRDLAGPRGVGMYDIETFHPDTWKPLTPAYLPFVTADRFDKFWGAKIVMRFTHDQIRAAVEAAELTDPRATEYLVKTIEQRQRATGRYWFSRVNPLDGFFVSPAGALCFEDLSVVHGFEAAATTAYTVTRYDQDGRAMSVARPMRPAASGRTCLPPLVLVNGGEGYTIMRIVTSRPGFSGHTDVHVAREPTTGAPRIIGVWRS